MPDYHRKIVDVDRLGRIVTELRRPTGSVRPPKSVDALHDSPGNEGKTSRAGAPSTIVQCHGCFDIVHPGHIRYLEFARSQGDVLVVSITGDAAIDKGVQRPYIPQELRAENLAALEFVDYVVIDPNATACALLETVRPDVYVKGHEYATSRDPRFVAEQQVVESYGGRVIFSSGQVVFSSSRLAEAMPETGPLSAGRLGLLCRHHGIDVDNLSALLGRMRGKRVLVLGDVVVERYVLCDTTGIASESPMMSLSELDRKDYLGGAATVALQLAGLGAEPILVTGVGGDQRSDRAVTELSDAGVGVRALRHRGALAMRTRFLVDDHKLFKVDRAAARPLDSVQEREAADRVSRGLAGGAPADAVIVHDGGFGMITPGLLRRLGATLRPAASRGGSTGPAAVSQAMSGGRPPTPHLAGIIAGGAGARGSLGALGAFDLLCCSERMLRVATNDFGGGLSALAYHVLQKTQARQMIVTLGKRGLVTFDRRSHDRRAPAWNDRLCSEHMPALADRVVDKLGCGESVLAVAALALASGADLMQAACLGAAAAAVQIGSLGLAAVGTEEIRRWTRRLPEPATAAPCVVPARRKPSATGPEPSANRDADGAAPPDIDAPRPGKDALYRTHVGV